MTRNRCRKPAAALSTTFVRFSVLAIIAVLTCSAVACSARAVSVGNIEPVTVRKGKCLNPDGLPTVVPIVYSDGKTAQRGVSWDLSAAGDPLYDDLVISGAIAGTGLKATLTVRVSSGDVASLRIADAEIAGPNLTDVMQRRLQESQFVDEWAWSPDHSVLALIFGERLCVWKVGQSIPKVVEAAAPGYPYHDLAWSFDGRFLTVYPHPSSESDLIALRYPELDVRCRLGVTSVGIWSPDSHELLVSVRGTGVDLAILNADTGETRILLKADPATVYRPDGWRGPGVALYSNLRAQGPATEDKTGLTIRTR